MAIVNKTIWWYCWNNYNHDIRFIDDIEYNLKLNIMRKLRKFILKCLPLGIIEWLAPKIGSLDSIEGAGTWYRIYDAKKPLRGAGVLIRRTNDETK